MFLSLAAHPLDLASVSAGIFDRAAPPPNQSTQCQPLSSANFLHEVDKVSPYSGHLNGELVQYSNGSKHFVHRMVRYSSHV